LDFAPNCIVGKRTEEWEKAIFSWKKIRAVNVYDLNDFPENKVMGKAFHFFPQPEAGNNLLMFAVRKKTTFVHLPEAGQSQGGN